MRTLALPLAVIALSIGCSEVEYSSDLFVPIDPLGDSTVLVDGRMIETYEVTADFIKADILIYGDTSYSMTQELTTMGQNVNVFIDQLSGNAGDWHLMAVTGPTGCNQGGILTPETDDYAGLFATGIMTPPADDSKDEMGLINVRAAINAATNGGCNDGFLRDDAQLHVIFISDENDESPGWETQYYWKQYIDPVIAAKDNPAMVKFSAVAGPVPGGCANADPGNGYSDAVAWTGGEFLSICDDWSAEMEILADSSVSVDHFELSLEPVVSSILVLVDGIDVVDDWLYSPGTNEVVFISNPPTGGQTVEISYEPVEVP